MYRFASRALRGEVFGCHRAYSVLVPSSASCQEVRGWVEGVTPVEPSAIEQLRKVASVPVVARPVAAMPDLHLGDGVAVGAVIPTTRAIIPAAVGVDIGCGIIAIGTSLRVSDIRVRWEELRFAIEMMIPHGRTHSGQAENDVGSWRRQVPKVVADAWRSNTDLAACAAEWDARPSAPKASLEERFRRLCVRYPDLERANVVNHLGTLGSGNHFIEVDYDESDAIWLMVHSGSRGIGNRIGQTFIELAKKDMGSLLSTVPDAELAYVREGTQLFDDYVEALMWAQDFASANRMIMMRQALDAIRSLVPAFKCGPMAINCHHNYVEKLRGYGDGEWLTRKGATSAREGELAVIPGSMGTPSFVVRGKGNPSSYESCSHGAGRAMSRGEAARRFSIADHDAATRAVCCRKDQHVIDETPMAYKDITKVMRAQQDLVDIVHTLRPLVCIKG